MHIYLLKIRVTNLFIVTMLCSLISCKATTRDSSPNVSVSAIKQNLVSASSDDIRNTHPISIHLPTGVIPFRLAMDDKYVYWINIRDPFGIDRVAIDIPNQVERVATSNTISKTLGTGFAGLQVSKDGIWMAYYDYVQYDNVAVHVVIRAVNISTGRSKTLFERVFDLKSLDRPVQMFIPIISIDNDTATLNYTSLPDASKCVYSIIDIYELNTDAKHELTRSACNSSIVWQQPDLLRDRMTVGQLDWASKPVKANAYTFDLKTGVSTTVTTNGKGSEPIILDNIIGWRNAYALDFSHEIGIHYLDKNVTRYVTLQQDFAHLYGAGNFLVASTPSRVDLIDIHDSNNIQVITIAAVDPDKLPPFGERTITSKYFAYVEYVGKHTNEPPQSVVWIYRLQQ